MTPASFYDLGKIDPRQLTDMRGGGHVRSAVGPLAFVQEARVIFVDIIPDANWGHECLYLFFGDGELLGTVHHNWPPADKQKMTRMKSEDISDQVREGNG